MRYRGYYFQLGPTSFAFVASAIDDTSKLSNDLRASIEGRLAALAGQEYRVIVLEHSVPMFRPEMTMQDFIKESKNLGNDVYELGKQGVPYVR